MNRVKYHAAAQAELFNKIRYLEMQTRGLGRRFLDEVKRAENLSEFPRSAEEIRPGVRKFTLRMFRHSLIYFLEEDHDVLVLAVAHHRRRPTYWLGRIDRGSV